MRKLFFLLAFVCALAVPSFAQSASDNTISGYVFDSFNDACVGCTFRVTVTRRDGVAVQYSPKTVTSTTGGAVSFTLPRKSFVLFQGTLTIGRYDLRNGVTFFIPDQSSTALENLQSVEDAAAALVAVASAPSDATYWTSSSNSTLSAEVNMGALTSGMLKHTVSGGVSTPATAVGGTDYEFPLTFAARLSRSTNTVDLAASGVSAGSCTACDLTIDTYGRVTAKASGSGGGGTVSSVFGRTGSVVAATNDYTWAQIDKSTSSLADITTRSASDLSSGTLAAAYGGAGTVNGILKANGSGTVSAAVSGTDYAPATSGSAILKGNGSGGFSSAASGTDYAPATSGTSILKGNGSGGFSNASAGTDYEVPLTFSTGLTRSTNTITVNTSQNIATLSNLTSNGLVTTSGGAGTLGVTVPGTGVLTALAVNVGSAGAFVVNGGALGTPSSGTLTSATGLPISTGVSGLGTGVATALAVNIGSAGAPTLFNGAGGTPSSLTLTNATGLPPTTGISGWPANASGVLTNNGSGTLSWAAAGGGITVGTTTITSGTNTKVLFNNSGVVGEYTVTGTGNAVLSASPTLTGTAVINAATVATGSGSGTGNVPGIVKVSAPAATTSGTTEETLDSYVIKANSLAAGKAIRVKVWFTMASNGNSKTVKITLGGTTIGTKTFTSNNLTATYDIVIIRSGSNAQECLAWYFIGNTSTWTDEVLTRTAATETDTSDITLAVKATTPTAAGDLTLRGFVVEFLN